MSVTLDPGVYILQISSERRDCWDQCYRIAAFFSGNVLSMADLPSQDVLNNFEVKQLTVGATELDSVRDLFHQVSVASTETQVTIEALPVDDVDSIVINPGDADTGTAGHQISLGGTGPQYVHVTVLGPDELPQRTHLDQDIALTPGPGRPGSAGRTKRREPDGSWGKDLRPDGGFRRPSLCRNRSDQMRVSDPLTSRTCGHEADPRRRALTDSRARRRRRRGTLGKLLKSKNPSRGCPEFPPQCRAEGRRHHFRSIPPSLFQPPYEEETGAPATTERRGGRFKPARAAFPGLFSVPDNPDGCASSGARPRPFQPGGDAPWAVYGRHDVTISHGRQS